MCNIEKNPREDKPKSSGKGSTSGGGSGGSSSGKPSKPSGKGRKASTTHMDICWRCGKGKASEGATYVKLWKQSVGTVPSKDIMRKCVWKVNLTHLVNVPETSTQFYKLWTRLFQWAWWPCVCSHGQMLRKSIRKKHLIQFLISANFKKVMNSDGTFHQVSYCSVESWHGSWCEFDEFGHFWQIYSTYRTVLESDIHWEWKLMEIIQWLLC